MRTGYVWALLITGSWAAVGLLLALGWFLLGGLP